MRTGLIFLQLKRPGPSGPDPHTSLGKTGNSGETEPKRISPFSHFSKMEESD